MVGRKRSRGLHGDVFRLEANGDSTGYIKTPDVSALSPLDVEDMMEDSPVPLAVANQHSDVGTMSPTPGYVHNDDGGSGDYDYKDGSMDDDSMMMDSPAPASRKTSLEGPRLPGAE